MRDIEKINMKNLVLAMMSILILIFPITAGYITTTTKAYTILTTDEANYILDRHINSAEINATLTNLMFPSPATHNYNEANNDTILWDTYGTDTVNYTNDITTVLDQNNAVVNFSVMLGVDQIFHQLDITTREIAQLDFILCDSNAQHGTMWLSYYHEGGSPVHSVLFDKTLNNKSLLIIDSVVWSDLMTEPDTEAFLSFRSILTTDTTYYFNMTGYNLDNSVWGWSNEGINQTLLIVGIIIGIGTLLFATDTIDIKLDKNRKDKK